MHRYIFKKVIDYFGSREYSLIDIYCLLWIILMMLFLIVSTIGMIGHTVYCSVVGTELFCHAGHSVIL